MKDIIWLILLLLLAIVVQEITYNISNIEKNRKNKNLNYKKHYRSKKYIMTKNELEFYKVLIEIAKELDLILFAQVSLYAIVETIKGEGFQGYQNRINKKSIDFVLVNKRNCEIKLCIELDDNTHRQEKRIERDNFINNLFEELKINLLRYKVYPTYYKETLKKAIIENMKEVA